MIPTGLAVADRRGFTADAIDARNPARARVAESKFAPHVGYARAVEGRIGLQDHGHEIRYRNIKIRPF